MSTENQRLLELAIQALETQQARIAQELAELRRRLTKPARRVSAYMSWDARAAKRTAPNKGKPMSAAQKKKIARAMKARWAEIRAHKTA